MSRRPPLLKLPAELQIEIAELLDDESLRALRLVSTGLTTNTFDIFADRFFACRRHAATNHSLRVLRDIIATPPFLRSMKRVELIAIGARCEYVEYNSTPGGYPTDSSESQFWCRDVDDAYSWRDAGILFDIFQSLAHVSSSCGLAFDYSTFRSWDTLEPTASDLTTEDPRPYHIKSIFGRRAYEDSVRPWMDAFNVTFKGPLDFTEVVLKTLFRSSYRPAWLEMGVPGTSVPPTGVIYHDTWITELSPNEKKGLNQVCRKLTDFDIDMGGAEKLSLTVRRMFKKMTHLRRLGVSCCSTQLLQTIPHHLVSNSVAEITLFGVDGPSHPLLSFLGHYQQTCTELALSYVLLAGGCPKEVFRFLLDSYPELQSVEIDQLAWIRGGRSFELVDVMVNGSTTATFMGNTQVKQALSKLLLSDQVKGG